MTAPFPPTGARVFGVGELTRDIKRLLEDAHGAVWVEGEVSNHKTPASGHQYLTLKDQEAPLACMLSRGVALRMRFDLQDGMQVIARGRLTVYVPRGEYQLQIEEVRPKGIGSLELAFRQLKEKLSVKGYFKPERKKKLPRIPRRVALITSGTGSAVRDMLEILGRRWPAAEVWVAPVRVQGEGAREEIAAAIERINKIAGPGTTSKLGPVDVLILGRGGGSLEDLWPFNEEIVANAIYNSRIPVVTGIGHEDDLTIADMVADKRALTPSEAAEHVVPNQTDVVKWLAGLEARCQALLTRNLELARSRLDALAGRHCFREPLQRIQEEERRLDDLLERLRRAMQQRLGQACDRLEAQVAQLESLSPLNVLARGYSLTRKEADRSVVRTAAQVQPGDRLLIHLHQGEIITRVEAVVRREEEAVPGVHHA
jgi:exodeoxyribonuclease VII large subunit